MSLPSDRKYAVTHEWFKVEGEAITVGITKFAADELTDITYVDLPAVGTKIEAGSEIGEIESVKATSELLSAVTGEIVAVNEALADAPELVNDKPFDEGWMVKISCPDPKTLDSLMDAAAYEKHIAAE